MNLLYLPTSADADADADADAKADADADPGVADGYSPMSPSGQIVDFHDGNRFVFAVQCSAVDMGRAHNGKVKEVDE
jgi:hypothetical protein